MAIDARTLLIATGTDAAVGLLCILCMAALRAGCPLLAGRLYTPRLETPAPFAPPPPGVPDPSWPSPPQLPVNPWRWALTLLRLDSATVAASAGADAAAFASLTLGFGLRLSLLLCALCVPTLVPVNLFGGALPWPTGGGGAGGEKGGGGRHRQPGGGGGGGGAPLPPDSPPFDENNALSYFSDLDRLSLANVEQGSQLMWFHLLAVYAVTFLTLWLLQTHSAAAARLRVRALAAARPGAAVAARTVLVTDVPGLPYGTLAQRAHSLVTGGGALSRVAARAAAAVGRAERGRNEAAGSSGARRRRHRRAGSPSSLSPERLPLLRPSSFHERLDEVAEEVREELDPELAVAGAGDEEQAAAVATTSAAAPIEPLPPPPSGRGIWARAEAALRANGGDVEELVRAEFERAYGPGLAAGGGGTTATATTTTPPTPTVVVAVHAVRRWPAAAAFSAARLATASQALADAVERRARQVERYWAARGRWEESRTRGGAAGAAPTPPPRLPRAPAALSPALPLTSPEAAAWLVSQFGIGAGGADAVAGGAAWVRELRRRHEAAQSGGGGSTAAAATTTKDDDDAENDEQQHQLPAAFVTFRTRWTAAVAATALHSRAAGGAAAWQVRPAPEPDDVLWGGAAISAAAEASSSAAEAVAGQPTTTTTTLTLVASRAAALGGAAMAAAAAASAAGADPTAPQRLALREWERRLRSVLLAAALLALGAFYTVPVGALQALLEVDALEKDFPWLRALLALPGVRPLLVAVLPGLALRLFIVALPAILAALIRRAGGAASLSEVDFAVARAYFGFQVWLVFFASFAAGSALAQARAMAASPERALRALGGAAPQTAGFFCSYLALQALLVRPLVLFRPWDALALALRTAVVGGKGGNGAAAARPTTPPTTPSSADAVVGQGVGWQLQPRPYGAVLPNATMAVLLAVAFAPVAPVLLPFSALFFGAASLTERHLAVYVVRRPFESGGRLWRHVRVQVVAALYVMQALALGLLLVKRFSYAFLVLPAPLIVAAATSPAPGSSAGGGGFAGAGGGGWDTLSLEDARALDAAEARRDAVRGVAEEERVGRIREAAAAYRSPPKLVDYRAVEELLELSGRVQEEVEAAESTAGEDAAAWRRQRERR
jgi:hypothetical protein